MNRKSVVAILAFIVFIIVLVTYLQSRLQCITGGRLHIKQNYVSNSCGLLNGVIIKEIKVDSFQNDIPFIYQTVRSTTLYRKGASPKNDPKKLYFDKDCTEYSIWQNDSIVTTVKEPMKFGKANWYEFSSYDTHTKIFMYVDKTGDRHFTEVSNKSEVVNF